MLSPVRFGEVKLLKPMGSQDQGHVRQAFIDYTANEAVRRQKEGSGDGELVMMNLPRQIIEKFKTNLKKYRNAQDAYRATVPEVQRMNKLNLGINNENYYAFFNDDERDWATDAIRYLKMSTPSGMNLFLSKNPEPSSFLPQLKTYSELIAGNKDIKIVRVPVTPPPADPSAN